MSAGAVVKEARTRAGLSQVGLALRAGTSQSVVSAYECGARQPSLPMLDRLIAAAGFKLDLKLTRLGSRARGPLGERLARNRSQVELITLNHGLSNVRIFGSVARGEERASSDIDLLVDVAPHVGIFELGRCRAELEELLGAPVDLTPAADLKSGLSAAVLAEVIPL